jgi:hypothetical protein
MKKTDAMSGEIQPVRRFAVIARKDLRWVAFILGGIAFLFGVAVLIGMALAELPLIFGGPSRSSWSPQSSR